ncbi:hypothetical protein [Chitinasiproducens palmae]|uniref:Uncharacterized protein n=1 Tax=Chitinasiproducens palmae TaxID=1770053 RepID=A0A1H2PL59_9BURK|nr:hypothetical protein [Chitinasiproducens palmae]SDV46763.1 hypothetical protein SAMN05216551_101616 [Chitinasiproducens palmae]
MTRNNNIDKTRASGRGLGSRPHGALLALLAATALAGCQREWVKPGASQQDFRTAHARCEADAYQRLPAATVPQQITPAGYTSGGIECTRNSAGGNDCKQKQVWRDATYTTRDANADGRSALIRNCMIQSGWTEKGD